MGVTIHGISVEATTALLTDLFEIDRESSPGSWDSFKMKLQTIKNLFDTFYTGSATVAGEYSAVISRQNNPPGGPVLGDRYLINTAPTGLWAGKANQIAEWSGVAWTFTVPTLDYTVETTDTGVNYRFNGTIWIVFPGIPVIHGGNNITTALQVGTKNTIGMILKTNNANRVFISPAGNVGFGLIAGLGGYLHVKAKANEKQLLIELQAGQTNANPVIQILDSLGQEMIGIRCDLITNTFVGRNTGAGNTVGYDLVAIGSDALPANTTGNSSTIVGKRAACFNQTGNSIIAIGAGASLLNVTGSGIVAVGHHAAMSSTSGDNLAIGNDALLFNTTGSGNVTIGNASMQNNITGFWNTVVGNAGFISGKSSQNCLMGYQVGYLTNNGGTNTAFGAYSMWSNVSGAGNAMFGYYSGYYETAGNRFYVDNQDRGNLANGRSMALMYRVFAATTANQSLAINGKVGINGAATTTSPLNVSGLPVSAAGLAAGDVWNNGGVLTIV
jgi:hypothetical protein